MLAEEVAKAACGRTNGGSGQRRTADRAFGDRACRGERANARKCRKLINRWRRSTRTDPFLEIAVNEFYESTFGGYRLAGYDDLAWLRRPGVAPVIVTKQG